METLAQLGPPMLLFLIMVAMPLFYSLPISLITAELATSFRENGGAIVCVKEAFGERIAWHVAFSRWFMGVADTAIFPVILSHTAIELIKDISNDKITFPSF